MELPPNQGPNVHAVQQDQVGAAYELLHGVEQASELIREQSRKAAAIQHARRSGSPEPYKRRVSVKRRGDLLNYEEYWATVGDDFDSVSHKRRGPARGHLGYDDFAHWAANNNPMLQHRDRAEQRHRGFHHEYELEQEDSVSDATMIGWFRDYMFGIAPGADRRREHGARRYFRGNYVGRNSQYPATRGSSGPADPLWFQQYPGFYKGFGPFS